MIRSWIPLLILSLVTCSNAVSAADNLTPWAEAYEEPAMQQAILDRIFPGQVGSSGSAVQDKETGMPIFTKNSAWIRLGKDKVYVPTSSGGPYLVVSCMLYNKIDRPPVTATSYMFVDKDQKPEAISSGYAGQESVYDLKLPKLKKRFVLLVDQFGQGPTEQWSASLVQVMPTGRAKGVWKSPLSARRFRFGFDPLGATYESLIMKIRKSGELQFSAYKWNGDRFEIDGFASEERIKALSDETWQYGAAL